jgi:hypothetical protein
MGSIGRTQFLVALSALVRTLLKARSALLINNRTRRRSKVVTIGRKTSRGFRRTIDFKGLNLSERKIVECDVQAPRFRPTRVLIVKAGQQERDQSRRLCPL